MPLSVLDQDSNGVKEQASSTSEGTAKKCQKQCAKCRGEKEQREKEQAELKLHPPKPKLSRGYWKGLFAGTKDF